MASRRGLRFTISDPATGQEFEVVDKYVGAELLGFSVNYFLHTVARALPAYEVQGQRRNFWKLEAIKTWKAARDSWKKLRCEICKREERGESRDLYYSYQRRSDNSWYSLCKKCHKRFVRLCTPWGHHELPGETIEEKQTWGWMLLAHSMSMLRRNLDLLESGEWKMNWKKKRVLIVEEDKLLRELLEETLRREGCVVNTKASLTAGIKRWRHYKWDGLYTSYQLGNRTAKKLIRRARKDGSLPIITSLSEPLQNGDVEELIDLEVKGIDKPFSFDQVIRYFRKAWREEEVRRP